MTPRLRRAAHVLAFILTAAACLALGMWLICAWAYDSPESPRRALGLAIMGAVVWGWTLGGVAMAYWQARIATPNRPIGGGE